MASAWPCFSFGKASSRMAWLKGTSGAPQMPCASRKITMLSRFHERPHSAEEITKPTMEKIKRRRRPSRADR